MDTSPEKLNELRYSVPLVRSLALRVEPKIDEGLPDLLMRSIAVNGFSKLRIILELMGINQIKSGLWSHASVARNSLDPELLAKALGLENDTVARLMYSKAQGLIDFFGAEISSFNLSNTRRVSPLFLREHGYQKAIWALRCFSFDPVNRESLLERCPGPGCGAVLGFRVTAGVNYCSSCMTDLRDFPQTKVVIDDEEALSFVVFLIDPGRCNRSWRLHEDLKQFSRGELFTLIIELAKLLDFHRLPELQGKVLGNVRHYDVSVVSLLDAARGLLGWPVGFFKLADEVRDTKKYRNANAKHPLAQGVPSSMKELKGFLVREFSLRLGSIPRGKYYFMPINSGAGAVIRALPTNVTAHAEQLGLPVGEVLSLYKSGAALCPDPNLRRNLAAPNFALPLDVEAFGSTLSKAKGGSAIVDVVQAARPSRHPWGRVFAAILRNEIAVSLRPSRHKPFVKCLFTTDEALLTTLCRRSETDIEPETEVRWRDVTFYLRTTSGSIRRLKTAGLLPAGRIALRDVWNIQEKYISAPEIRFRLQVRGNRPALVSIVTSMGSAEIDQIVPGVGLYSRPEGERYISERLALIGDEESAESKKLPRSRKINVC